MVKAVGGKVRKEVIIDEYKLQSYAERMIPHVMKISEYVSLHSAIYTEMERYKGDAQKEFETYQEAQLKQLNLVGENYMCLANILNEIVMKFIEADGNSAARIEGYATKIMDNYGGKDGK